jgi:hypothetical protein
MTLVGGSSGVSSEARDMTSDIEGRLARCAPLGRAASDLLALGGLGGMRGALGVSGGSSRAGSGAFLTDLCADNSLMVGDTFA